MILLRSALAWQAAEPMTQGQSKWESARQPGFYTAGESILSGTVVAFGTSVAALFLCVFLGGFCFSIIMRVGLL